MVLYISVANVVVVVDVLSKTGGKSSQVGSLRRVHEIFCAHEMFVTLRPEGIN